MSAAAAAVAYLCPETAHSGSLKSSTDLLDILPAFPLLPSTQEPISQNTGRYGVINPLKNAPLNPWGMAVRCRMVYKVYYKQQKLLIKTF